MQLCEAEVDCENDTDTEIVGDSEAVKLIDDDRDVGGVFVGVLDADVLREEE